jgi:hypothetical protein
LTKHILAILAVFCVCSSVANAAQGGRVDLSCVTSLELPTHGLLAAAAAESGTVDAEFYLDADGQVSKLELRGGNPGLRGEVRVAIELSKFAARCKGRQLKFIFAFTLEDPPTDSILPPAVRFVPPNRFELTFRRVKPNYDPGSPPPKSQ